jgi:hypothetical protein
MHMHVTPHSVPWMVTLTLLGLWMFLSLTLVKEGDLGRRIRPSANGGAGPTSHSNSKPAAAAAATAAAIAAAVAGVNPIGTNGRRGVSASSALTRKEVTVGVVQVRAFGGVVSVCFGADMADGWCSDHDWSID